MTKVDRISSNLRERIRAGEWAGGQGLPSRGQFAEEYEVSPATITGAVRCLQREGLLRVIQGKGAFATNYKKNGTVPMLNTPIGLTGSYVPFDRELSHLGMEGLFARPIFDGIWKAANDEHCPIVLLPTLSMQTSLTREYCRQTGVQGLIFLGGEGYANARVLREEGFPIILANKPLEATPLSYVDYDNGAMVRQMVGHFAEAGHQRIAALYSEGSVSSYFEGMKLDFLAALQKHKLIYAVDDYWRKVDRDSRNQISPNSIRRQIRALFALPAPPTALFCWDSAIATAAMAVLETAGLREKLSIQVSSYMSEADAMYSGFVIPHYELGEALVHHLRETIHNPYHCAQILIQLKFVDRKTIHRV